MIAISLSLLSCGLTSSSAFFLVSWCVVNFFFSSTFGAISSVIRENFEESQWSTQLGLSAAASRVGAMVSSVLFGLVISFVSNSRRIQQHLTKIFSGNPAWRSVFLVSGSFQFIMALIFLVGTNSNTKELNRVSISHKSSKRSESVPQILERLSHKSSFWLMLSAKTLLMMVSQIMSFLPLYLTLGPARMPTSQAAAAAGVFSVRVTS